jgi:hypothetical protein
VPEPDHLVKIDQPSPVRGIPRPAGDADSSGRAADELEVAGGVRGRDQQPGLDRPRQLPHLTDVVLDESVAHRERFVRQAGGGELFDRQLVGEVDQRQRIAARGPGDASGRDGIDR